MFTGIIEAMGVVGAVQFPGDPGDRRLRVESALFAASAVAVGDSVAVNGVCLTAVELSEEGFHADVSAETLSCTTLGQLTVGRRVNLERALTPATPLGGHLVSGHVDGTTEVMARREEARSVRLEIGMPSHLARYVAVKGSICVDGVSLTVNDVEDDRFGVNIVPHTLSVTTLGEYVAGRQVNLEVDLVARYLERLLQARDV
jgi:riboflavin synthase